MFVIDRLILGADTLQALWGVHPNLGSGHALFVIGIFGTRRPAASIWEIFCGHRNNRATI